MVRISLIAAAALATIATASPVFAQANASVRALNLSITAETSSVAIVERKVAPCADKTCAGKPFKRGYVAAAPLGW